MIDHEAEQRLLSLVPVPALEASIHYARRIEALERMKAEHGHKMNALGLWLLALGVYAMRKDAA